MKNAFGAKKITFHVSPENQISTVRSLVMICIFCVQCLSFDAFAQSIELNETRAIKELNEAWTARNRSTHTMEGWRIQVASSTDRFEVQNVKERFLATFPGISCDWYHEKPYYKLKAGAFKHSWEARRVIAQVRAEFPSCYPVYDKKIKPSDFLISTAQ